MTKFNRFGDVLGIFVISLCLFILGLQSQEIVGFEARFYVFAMEMLRNGPSLFPTTYGHYYPDYPVVPTFLIYSFAKLFGFLDKTIAVLPSAIAASITVSTTYLIGATFSRRYGILAACFMLLTNMFVMEARTISPDQYVVMVTTLAFYCVYSSEMTLKFARLSWLPILFLFGMACRGPIGFIVPAGVISVFYILEKDLKKFFIFCIGSLLFLILGCGILFYLAQHVGGDKFAESVWRMQVANRLANSTLPWYFYFKESIGAYAISYPLAILTLLGMMPSISKKNLSKEAKFIWKLLGWALVILIGLSIPAGKKIRYILAFTPALALLSASLFAFQFKNLYLMWLKQLVKIFCSLLPSFGIVITLFAYVTLQHKGISLQNFYPGATIDIFILLQLLIVIIRKHDVKLIATAAFSFVMMYVCILEPVNVYLNRARVLVTQVEFIRNLEHANLVFYHEAPDGLPIKYLADMHDKQTPKFIYQVDQLQILTGKNVIVTSEEYYSQLPNAILQHAKILYKGYLGREPMVAFQFQ